MHACSRYWGSEVLGCRTLRLESQSSTGLRMQPYPRSPDRVWPGHLHGTGCLSARAMDTGFPAVVRCLCLGLGFVLTPPFPAGVSGGFAWFWVVAWLRPSWFGFAGLAVSPPSGGALHVRLGRGSVVTWARFPATPGWGPLAVVVGGPSPLLAGGCGRGSPPLLVGVRWLWWRWPLATPGCGIWVRFPATPGWGPLVVVVGGPSPLLAEGPGRGAPPLLAWVRWLWWWVVPRHSRRRVLGAVPLHSWLGSAGCGGGGPSPLLALGPGRGPPPLLVRVRWLRWWWPLATPGCGPWARFPATPGWGPLAVVVGAPPPPPDLELLAAAILWESRKNGDSFRKLQYSRAHSQWKCPWGTLMQVRKALSAPRVTEVHFQTDEDNDIFGAACNLWQKLQVFSPCTKAFPGDRSR